jgi:ribosomal-protein-alanine N-acetyltransferase
MFEGSLSLPTTKGLLFEEEGQIKGYILGGVLFEEAEIFNVAVPPEYRKQGFAKRLMTAFEEVVKSQGALVCFLEVRVSNLSALCLYQKFGYEKIGVRKKYYADGEDAFVMKKTL